jgi:hypothetical protein
MENMNDYRAPTTPVSISHFLLLQENSHTTIAGPNATTTKANSLGLLTDTVNKGTSSIFDLFLELRA